MHSYIHKVKYYETDKMGITHHSNYVRWMEEARMDFLSSVGFGMRILEDSGIASPVVSLECRYLRTTTFDDEIRIDIALESYSGVKLVMVYRMTDTATGNEVMTAKSTHCFINQSGKPIAVKRTHPDFDLALRSLVEPR
ncbi:MAG: acyl-CoA thioesterase [Ruminococcaceae bacterium]|nr:acyl-CoA thioesterase [Oscillospiraceae bacterium]